MKPGLKLVNARKDRGGAGQMDGYAELIAHLANTDLDVFELCLGGNVFGWTLDEQRSFAVLDAYVAAGGNFIDTADSYGRRGPNGPGESERIIGRWMAARANRDQLVIATKVGSSPDLPGLSPATISQGARRSLQRLGTEQIDLYYAHKDDPQTPLEQTLAAFGELIEEGLVRYAAASNYDAARLQAALSLGERDGMASYVALQPHYNLLERDAYERELAPVCARHGLACFPYFGLAQGFLTGKYRPDAEHVDSPRAAGVRDRYLDERGLAVLRALDAIAAEHDVPPAAVALAWLREQPTVLAPIASATSPDQVEDLVASARLSLSQGDRERLSEASARSSA
jgi:aryl-alcohol dehydrogenase-like predicted oxidoreductase